MTLGEYIKFCLCNRFILTTEQMRENKPCELCQKEHAEGFKDRLETLQKEEA
jgi:hypothetical protein